MEVNFSNVAMGPMALHRVGNKQREERNFVSKQLFAPPELLRPELLRFFLKSLRKSDEWYRFAHSADLSLHELHTYARQVFENPDSLLAQSEFIVQHLYNQSTHPNIKTGEVYVVWFSDLLIDDEVVNALGIFKSEQKQGFLNVLVEGGNLGLNHFEGIPIDKLDKGCLILDTEASDGYRVLSVDNNSYDTQYWMEQFLGIERIADEHFYTSQYLGLVQAFSEEVVGAQSDAGEKIRFMARSVDFFNQHETFDLEQFAQTVIPNEETAQQFRDFKEERMEEVSAPFEISRPVLKKAQRKIPSSLQFDNQIQIRLDPKNPEASFQHLERGFDEERGMYFYKVYFNEEL